MGNRSRRRPARGKEAKHEVGASHGVLQKYSTASVKVFISPDASKKLAGETAKPNKGLPALAYSKAGRIK